MSTETVDPAVDTSGDDAFERAAAEEGIDLGGSKPVETPAPATPAAETAPTGDAPAKDAAETPAAAAAQPWKFKAKLKIDGREEDAEADEAELVSALQVHRNIENIRAREALRGAKFVVDALKSQGIDAELWLNPATNAYEPRVKAQVTTPAPTPAATPAKPADTTVDIEALKRAAREGDAEAFLKLREIDEAERTKLAQRIENWQKEREESERKARVEAEAREMATAAEMIRTKYAKAFEGPTGTQAWNYAISAASAEAQREGSTKQSVLAVLEGFAALREQERSTLIRQSVPVAKTAPTPPPVVGGHSAPPPARQDSGPPSPSDPDYDNKLQKWLQE